MTDTERTIKCPICGKPYKVYAFYAGDQSACPACVASAEKLIEDGKKRGWHWDRVLSADEMNTIGRYLAENDIAWKDIDKSNRPGEGA